jgi:nitrile hydratase subunit alpha
MTAVEHTSSYSDYEARTRAIETLLYERGIVTPSAVDEMVNEYENNLGPMRGAKVVARSWADPKYRAWLLKDSTAAIAEMGYAGEQAHQIAAVECTPEVHHVVVCTLCSCYPWPVLGLPPAWYKSMAYRSRMVADPRGTLQNDFGMEIPKDVAVQVWDSSSEVRYIVIPERPSGTEGWAEDQLVDLVTRDSMIGTGKALTPAAAK